MAGRRACRTPPLPLGAALTPAVPRARSGDGEGAGPRRLVLHPRNPDGPPLATPAWAAWAQRLSPAVGLEGEAGLVLDTTGLAHLHGGEGGLLAHARAVFAEAGMPVRALLGRSPAALAALLRAGHPSAVLAPGEEARLVARLPVAALALPPETRAALENLGLRDVAALERQPRGPLARRFGQALIRGLEALRGDPRPIRPLRPPPRHAALVEPPSPLSTAPALERALARLVAEIYAGLRAEGAGARGLLLHARRVDGTAQRLRQGVGRASRDPSHLLRLLAARVEELRPEEGFERLALRAHPVEPLPAAQGDLSGKAAEEELAALLDRLGQRLELWRLAPGGSHWPERAARRVPAHETPDRDAQGGAWPERPPRPVRLLRRPVPVEAVALLPDAPPSLLRLGRARAERVVAAEGPERILPEWWREGRMPPPRDYYRVQLASGPRLWVCRSGAPGDPAGRWFVHGHLP